MELGVHPNSAFVCFMAFFKLNLYMQTVKNSFSAVPEKKVFQFFKGPQLSLSFEESSIENM